MRIPFAFGLTGGIASGKSTVSKTFASHGIPIVDADQIARDIVRPREPALVALVRAFGDEILTPEGEMDRPKVGAMVFGDADKLTLLNATISPFLRKACQEACFEQVRLGHRIVCFDAPLLLEKNLQSMYRPVVVVYCDIATQIKRMKTRNGFTEEEARARIATQATHEQRLWHADFLINTDNTMEETKALAEEVLEKIYAWSRRIHPRSLW